ncbi:unnamed protein product [Zymoseptoria tritici ST99CH_1A5]|uniref:Uncharacterized protein n=3 Tax=Zymoseptoria tritici TaxID=1047171 RepID=F9XJB3_ZYMTI|nr:uncharacterized protein MYCGRDRAFT_110804 [Zymoseptoria tritici IPO323]EGP84423.1 hypothetical protein MYCGRDRAFT_110804 [Zymoseptoria tritici IPO323]SMR58609.1 unnamed protein product [Zymoseptoria tritici ST99CH_1E4]SMR61604.1 unnamed protein product [Zymoseptoria tritici ST99CH_3D1]SMY27815.1 unnamed protein product [Zymoseptoria tritici ST99CH_1A5]
MDLLVIKANGPFRQIMNGGRDPIGRQISDLAGFADGESFFNLRNRLRAEREAREPVYMPPIMQQGHDPLGGASELDVDRYTHGFDDGTYTWHRLQGGPSEAPFPARIRLGKANAYFVAVTLPSFRPVEMPAQPQVNPPAFGRSPPDSHSMRTSPPDRPQRAGFVPYTETPMLPAQPTPQTNRPAVQQMPRSYPPPHLPMPPLHRQVSQASVYPAYQTTPLGTPRLSIAEPPTETTAFTPRASSRETQAVPVPPPSLQLPPIVGNRTPLQSPYPTAGPFPALPSGQAPLLRSESDEDGRQESPKKRRRMDIDDVLHR